MTVYCLKASIIQRLVKYTLYTDQQVGHAADLLERISPPFVGGFVSALGGRISLHPEWREVDLQLRRILKRSLSTATGQPVGGRAPIMRENKRQQTAPQSPIPSKRGQERPIIITDKEDQTICPFPPLGSNPCLSLIFYFSADDECSGRNPCLSFTTLNFTFHEDGHFHFLADDEIKVTRG